MNDDDLLETFKKILPFLGNVLGPGVEVVLHDTRDLKHSLVAIENSLSGRKAGDPITDLASDFFHQFNKADKSSILNYFGKDHNSFFLNSTYFIRNKQGNIIGFLCINKDLKALNKFENAVSALLNAFNLQRPFTDDYVECLTTPVDRLLTDRISQAIAQQQILTGSSTLSVEDKITILSNLQKDGLLNMKNALTVVARQFDVSVPTIYRYLKKIKEN